MDTKKEQKRKIIVKTCFNQYTFQEIAQDAVQAGFRHGGHQLFKQKPHGYDYEKIPNSTGISKFLKYTWRYWQKSEPERLAEQAQIEREKRELAEREEALRVKNAWRKPL